MKIFALLLVYLLAFLINGLVLGFLAWLFCWVFGIPFLWRYAVAAAFFVPFLVGTCEQIVKAGRK